jgi:hypothetical protein
MQGGASLCFFIHYLEENPTWSLFGALAGLSLSLLLPPSVRDNPIDLFPFNLAPCDGRDKKTLKLCLQIN